MNEEKWIQREQRWIVLERSYQNAIMNLKRALNESDYQAGRIEKRVINTDIPQLIDSLLHERNELDVCLQKCEAAKQALAERLAGQTHELEQLRHITQHLTDIRYVINDNPIH